MCQRPGCFIVILVRTISNIIFFFRHSQNILSYCDNRIFNKFQTLLNIIFFTFSMFCYFDYIGVRSDMHLWLRSSALTFFNIYIYIYMCVMWKVVEDTGNNVFCLIIQSISICGCLDSQLLNSLWGDKHDICLLMLMMWSLICGLYKGQAVMLTSSNYTAPLITQWPVWVAHYWI